MSLSDQQQPSCSQLGADDFVLSLFPNRNGFFLDVGAADGQVLSNTAKLERAGWQGIAIDPLATNFEHRAKTRLIKAVVYSHADQVVDFAVCSQDPNLSGVAQDLCSYRQHVLGNAPQVVRFKTVLLSELLDSAQAPRMIEYMSLDTEGSELAILSTFPFDRYTFGVITVEHNYEEPKRSMIRQLLEQRGYMLAAAVQWDDWRHHDALDCDLSDATVPQMSLMLRCTATRCHCCHCLVDFICCGAGLLIDNNKGCHLNNPSCPMSRSNARFLAGKVAMVTGSTSGIGLAVLKALAGAGANVAMHGLGDRTALAKLQQQIASENGVRVMYSDADLRQPKAIREAIARAAGELGGLDILHNNAGIQFVGPVETYPEDKWDAIMDVCLNSTFHCTKAALPHMLKAGWGRVINTGSMHSLVASPYKAAYNAAKHGVAGFTKTLALELALKNITVNAICPGYVLTDLVRNQIEDTARVRGMPADKVVSDVMLADQPTKKFVAPEDIAAMVLHLCGPHSASITGACLSVDGGWTCR